MPDGVVEVANAPLSVHVFVTVATPSTASVNNWSAAS